MRERMREGERERDRERKRGDGRGTHLLPDFGQVPGRQYLQVWCQGTALDDALVAGLLHGRPEHDVAAQRGVLYPGLLGHVGHGALPRWNGQRTHVRVGAPTE